MEAEPDSTFVKLLTDHQSVIRSFIISLLPGAPGVDDVIQETNMVLWKKRETFELGTNFKAWVLKTARYQAMSYCWILKKRRWVTLDDDVAELVADEIEANLDREMVEKRIKALRSCIEKVRPEDRELLMQGKAWFDVSEEDKGFTVMTDRVESKYPRISASELIKGMATESNLVGRTEPVSFAPDLFLRELPQKSVSIHWPFDELLDGEFPAQANGISPEPLLMKYFDGKNTRPKIASGRFGTSLDLQGMMWMQGESDASAAYATSYQTNLTTFITDIRATYGADLPFVIGRLSSGQTNLNSTYLNQIRNAQDAVASADP